MPVVAPRKAEKLISVRRQRAKLARPFRKLLLNCQFTNSTININAKILLNDLFSAGSTEDCVIFQFKHFGAETVCFVNICNKIKRHAAFVNSSLTIYRPVAGGGAGRGGSSPPQNFWKLKNITVNVQKIGNLFPSE